jgi:hypothetical protein
LYFNLQTSNGGLIGVISNPVIDVRRITWEDENGPSFGVIIFNSQGVPTSNSTANGSPFNYAPLTLQKMTSQLPPPIETTIYSFTLLNAANAQIKQNAVITAVETDSTEAEYTGVIDWTVLTNTTSTTTTTTAP